MQTLCHLTKHHRHHLQAGQLCCRMASCEFHTGTDLPSDAVCDLSQSKPGNVHTTNHKCSVPCTHTLVCAPPLPCLRQVQPLGCKTCCTVLSCMRHSLSIWPCIFSYKSTLLAPKLHSLVLVRSTAEH